MALLSQEPVTSVSGTGNLPLIPDFQMQALRQIAGQGAAIAGEEFQPYQGPRIAGLTDDQLTAMGLTREMAASSMPDMSAVSGAISRGLAEFDPNEVKKYMSPYTSGVIDEIARLGERNLTENLLPNVNTTFTGAGQFGSTRNADFTNRALRDVQESILGAQSTALQKAMTGALNQYYNWSQQALPAATSAMNLGTGATAQLQKSGALQQAQDQSNLDLAYRDWQEQLQYPKTQLNWYSNLMQGNAVQPGQSSTSTQTAYMPSGLQTAISTYGLLSGVK